MRLAQQRESCDRAEAADIALDLLGFRTEREISRILSKHFLLAGKIKACERACDTEELYKKLGKWRDSESYSPLTGDLVIHVGVYEDGSFDGDKLSSGFVYANDGRKLTVIGTDRSGTVTFYNLRIGEGRIKGYCCPLYEQQ